jgi:hypothetical protein
VFASVSRTVAVCREPPRSYVTSTALAGPVRPHRRDERVGVGHRVAADRDDRRRPRADPAAAAGPPTVTSWRNTRVAPSELVASPTETPICARLARPVSMSCWAMAFAWSIGMAKPTPMLPACPPNDEPAVAIALLMPTTWPAHVDERTAGVAGVDRGVGLDRVDDGRDRGGTEALLSVVFDGPVQRD